MFFLRLGYDVDSEGGRSGQQKALWPALPLGREADPHGHSWHLWRVPVHMAGTRNRCGGRSRPDRCFDGHRRAILISNDTRSLEEGAVCPSSL